MKKLFPDIKVGFYPWSVPQAAGGIMTIIMADDEQTLEKVIQETKLGQSEFEMCTLMEAQEMMAQLIA